MAKKKKQIRAEAPLSGRQPIEDRVLKQAAQFFGEELLPLLGVRERVRKIAPTEQVHLEMKDFNEDFNFEMEDGTWRHLEFESDQIEVEDLRRFRAYEAICSYYYGVEVITSVLCTSDVENIKAEFMQGINRYRVDLFRMRAESADELIAELETAQKERSLKRPEMVKLLLSPLMSGKMSQPERIRRSLRMVQQERDQLGREDLLRMESLLYALAVKFLTKVELNKLEEVFGMTILGQMLEERGKAIGTEIGKEIGQNQKLIELICRKLKRGKNPETIAGELEEDVSLVREICRIAGKFAPDYNAERVYEAWQGAFAGTLKEKGCNCK